MKVEVYTKDACPFCDQAKALLASRGIEFVTVNIESIPEARTLLVDRGLKSVPQIFLNSILLPGGFQGLAAQPNDFWTNLKDSNVGI